MWVIIHAVRLGLWTILDSIHQWILLPLLIPTLCSLKPCSLRFNYSPFDAIVPVVSPRNNKCFSVFRQANSKLCDSFTMVFTQNSSIYTEQCTSPSLFHNFEVSQGGSNRSLKNYDFISDTIFKICTHAHKSLSNETIIFKIAELEIWLCAWRRGDSLTFIVDSVFGQSLVNDSSAGP